MNVTVSKPAIKDIEKLTEAARNVVLEQLVLLNAAETLGSMGNVIKMKGTKHPLYRLKIDNHRIMIEKTDTGIIILSVSDRKDAYKKK